MHSRPYGSTCSLISVFLLRLFQLVKFVIASYLLYKHLKHVLFFNTLLFTLIKTHFFFIFNVGANALFDILMGDINPSGKLQANWVRSVGQVNSGSVPWYQSVRGKWVANARGKSDPYDGRVYDNYAYDVNDPTPLFYFGFGMSYTTFNFTKIVIKSQNNNMNGLICDNEKNWLENKNAQDNALNIVVVQFQITNTGTRDGATVAQIYVEDPTGVVNVVRPWKRLGGFIKVFLKAGETIETSVTLSFDDLAWSGDGSGNVGSEKLSERKVMKGKYIFSVGDASNEDSLRTDYVLSCSTD